MTAVFRCFRQVTGAEEQACDFIRSLTQSRQGAKTQETLKETNRKEPESTPQPLLFHLSLRPCTLAALR